MVEESNDERHVSGGLRDGSGNGDRARGRGVARPVALVVAAAFALIGSPVVGVASASASTAPATSLEPAPQAGGLQSIATSASVAAAATRTVISKRGGSADVLLDADLEMVLRSSNNSVTIKWTKYIFNARAKVDRKQFTNSLQMGDKVTLYVFDAGASEVADDLVVFFETAPPAG